MEEIGIKVVEFVPAVCTDRHKSLVKYQVQRFFANEVKSALEKGNAGENVENDLHVSEIKAIHAKCKYLYLIHTIE